VTNPPADRPVVLHWLGEMFDPQLAGYWGSRDVDEATRHVLALVDEHAARVDGIKVSLLDAEHEVALRRALPDGVRLYTGDDFNFPELIRGDDRGASDALLGAFDAIAPAASTALQALDAGDLETYDRVLAPTLPLSRHIFGAPTYHYKTGIVFLAWLNGHQEHFRLLGGLESARPREHLEDVYALADRAGLIRDPELAAARMRHALA
jgi:dihydrodipicolinate synthase/N-acetylneuraminate lyase